MKSLFAITFFILLSAQGALALPGQSTSGNKSLNAATSSEHHLPKSLVLAGDDYTKAALYQSRVMELISYSLDFYLEELILWKKPTVTFRHPCAAQFGYLNDVVTQALTLYDHPARDSFWGFSGRLEKSLLNLQQYEGYTIDYSDANTSKKEKHISATQLKNEIEQLKEASAAEVADFIESHPDPIDSGGKLLNLSNDVPQYSDYTQDFDSASQEKLALLIDSLFELDEVPHELIGQVKTQIETLKHPRSSAEFRKYQQLDPVVHLIERITMADESELEVAVPTRMTKKSKKQRRSGPGEFNARVIELLEENNHLMARYSDRFDQMHSDINQLKINTEESDRGLQSQIDEIREMVSNSSARNDADRLHAPTTVIFEKNSTQLSMVQQAQLNQVLGEMMKNPSENIMVTGYADATGNREHNILLSKKRALNVYNYLTERGVNAARLTMNFVGAEDSESANPLDRKVVIEWFKK